MMTYTDRKKDTVKESTSRMILFKLDKFKQKNIGCGCPIISILISLVVRSLQLISEVVSRDSETLLQRNSWESISVPKKALS